MSDKLQKITVPIKDFNKLKIVDYDYSFLKHYHIMYYFREKHSVIRETGIVYRINSNGTITIITNENVTKIMLDKNLEILFNRDIYGKLYFYSNTRIYPNISINKLKVEFMKQITMEELILNEHNMV